MLNDDLTPDGLVYCAEARSIIPVVKKVLSAARKADIKIVYLNRAS